MLQEISHTHRDNIFAQASLNVAAWQLAVQVMDLFEKAKLKGQKLRLATLVHKPEFKQNYLTPIRSLSVQNQCNLLSKVANLELSLAGLQVEANKLKQLASLKVSFTKMVNVDSWEEAQNRFPHYASDEQLGRFSHIDVKKKIPKSFTDFCHRAKTLTDIDVSSSSTVVVRRCSVSVLQSSVTEVSGSQIRLVDTEFKGANLILCSVVDDSQVENIAYTIKEINSFFGCNEYVAAMVIPVEVQQQVLSIWTKAFTTAELLFVADVSQKGMCALLKPG